MILAFIITIPGSAFSQDYSFSQESTTYQELTNGIEVTRDFKEVNYRVALKEKLPDLKPMSFFGVDMNIDSMIAGGPGFVLIGSQDDKYAVALDPFFVGKGISVYDTSSSLSYGMMKRDGKNYFVVQWKNIQSEEYPGEYCNAQLLVEEKTNHVTFHYGPSSLKQGTTSPEGIQVGVFLLSGDFQQLYKMNLVSGDPATPVIRNLTYANLDGYPVDGTEYIFNNDNYSSVTNLQFVTTSVYPNPSESQLNIESNVPFSVIEITDMTGRRVQNVSLEANMLSAVINTTGIKSGTYQITLYDKQQVIKVERFTKL